MVTDILEDSYITFLLIQKFTINVSYLIVLLTLRRILVIVKERREEGQCHYKQKCVQPKLAIKILY